MYSPIYLPMYPLMYLPMYLPIFRPMYLPIDLGRANVSSRPKQVNRIYDSFVLSFFLLRLHLLFVLVCQGRINTFVQLFCSSPKKRDSKIIQRCYLCTYLPTYLRRHETLNVYLNRNTYQLTTCRTKCTQYHKYLVNKLYFNAFY